MTDINYTHLRNSEGTKYTENINGSPITHKEFGKDLVLDVLVTEEEFSTWRASLDEAADKRDSAIAEKYTAESK